MKKTGQKSRELLFRDKSTCEYVESLYPREDKADILRRIWKKRLTALGILFLAAAAVWLYCFLSKPQESVLKDGKYLLRQEEDSVVDLEVSGREGDRIWQKNISLNVRQRKFTAQEKEELDRKLEDCVVLKLRGDNDSLENVTKPLRFATELPGTDAVLEWSWDEEYIRENGSLSAAGIPPGGVDTDIMLKASWRNWERTRYFNVHLMPPELSQEKRQIREAKLVLKQTLKDTAFQEMVALPDKAGSMKLDYRIAGEKKSYVPVCFILGLILLIPLFWREKQKKDLAARTEQMILDYPGLVNKVMLLLGAGLTFRKAVERLGIEYEEKRREGAAIHYAYEELCIMMQEMRDGVSEGKALERFGRKCRLMPYLKFSSVIAQNLKKGAEGILELLEKESLEAAQQRRERVLQMGETAGTKLLFPMMVMLGLVMGIIMVPAFMTL